MIHPVQAVIFDVDGTLYDYRTRSILPSTLEAIEALRRQEIAVVIASGRSYSLLGEDLIRQVRPDYYVLANGHELLRGDGAPVKLERFTLEQTQRLVDIARERGLHLMLKYHGFNCIYSGWEEMLKVFCGIGPLRDAFRYCPTGNYHLQELPLGMTVKGPSHLREYLADCGADFRVEYFHDPTECDVFHSSTNKLTGLKNLLAEAGIPLENCVAFGDSGNDLEMLAQAGFGVAMGNGTDAAKRAAKLTCGCSWEDGIYQSLSQLGLI